jgi:hypothetical protein
MQLFITILQLVVMTTYLSSCATIVNDDTVRVPITTNPAGAVVTVGGLQYVAPADLILTRGTGDFTVTIEKAGYQSVSLVLEQSPDGWMWGNILLGGLIGLIVDLASGDGYDLEPERLNITLQPHSLVLGQDD